MEKFLNIKFFKSLKENKNNQIIAQVSIEGINHIILVPVWFQEKINLSKQYTVYCEPLRSGRGFLLKSFEEYVPNIEVIITKDNKEILVLVDKKETTYSFSIDGELSPRNFYDKKCKKFPFPGVYFRRWRKALQDISQFWEIDWRNEWEVTTVNKVLSELKEKDHPTEEISIE